MKLNRNFKMIGKICVVVISITILWALLLGVMINNYSKNYVENKSDVAIVLGAAVWDSIPSPVFRERINHAIYLYKKKKVKYLIFTGGIGKGKTMSEGVVGMKYAMKFGIPNSDIFYEEKSKVTYTNLKFAKEIMDEKKLNTALIVSDPMHMKRSIDICKNLNIEGNPSPTKTSLFKSFKTKFWFLRYEIFYYTGDLLGGKLKFI